MQWKISQEHDGMIIRTYLQEVHQFSRRLLISLKKEEDSIQVNGVSQWVTYTLCAGDTLFVRCPEEKQSDAMEAEKIPLEVMYEDEYCLVVCKPAGQACLPSMNHRSKTLANGLAFYYQEHSIPATIHIVTRLDVQTSGLVLIAKNQYVHSLFSKMQKSGQIHRTYEAIVRGLVTPTSGNVNEPISRKEGSIIERTVDKVHGKQAITYYKVLEYKQGISRLKVVLGTGRTHQIRVHFQYLGHPLLGDDLYGGCTEQIHRQALHCKRIEWIHPITTKPIRIDADLPLDMKKLLDVNEIQ